MIRVDRKSRPARRAGLSVRRALAGAARAAAVAAIGVGSLLRGSPAAAAPVGVPMLAVSTPADAPPAPPSRDRPRLPEPPEGVTQLWLDELFELPVGDFGLEFSDKARSLDGRRVRVLGYMVRRTTLVGGRFLMAPIPITLHDAEMGPCDDLPASTLVVIVPGTRSRPVPFAPGPLLLTGRLSLGNREEPDGRLWPVRLELDSLEPAAPADPAPRSATTAEPTAR